MSRWSPNGSRYRRMRKQFLQDHPVCWWCRHDHADEIDHYIPASLAPHLRMSIDNWRAMHGTGRCPTCGRACNQERGNRMQPPPSRRSRRW